jgi:hypothetical protein
MISGWLPLPPGLLVPAPRPAHPLVAAVTLAAAVGAATVLVFLSRFPP